MGLKDTIKRLIKLVHDPVDSSKALQPDAETRQANARNEADTYGRQSGLG